MTPGTTATANITYVAKTTRTPQEYTITWKNGDETLKEENYHYGDKLEYDGETPVRQPDAQYEYTFSGYWTSSDVQRYDVVRKNATFQADFNRTLRKYTVTWKDDDGNVLETDQNVPYDDMPVYNSQTPTKEASTEYTYAFDGWTPDLSVVREKSEYTAVFKPEKKSYTVTFVNDDGSVLQTSRFEYDTKPAYSGVVPSKAPDAEHTYNFASWQPEITPVKGDQTYKAVYTASDRLYSITYIDDDGKILKTVSLKHGILTSYEGTPAKEATAQYSYKFKEWQPVFKAVEADQVYTAVFEKTIRKYEVTFYDEDGTTPLYQEAFAYGSMPEYKGAESHKAETATTLFIFTGWDPILQEVRDTQTYKATYKENLKELTVTLKYDDKETTLTVGYNQALDETKVPVPAKSDMNFGGWYTKDDQKWELADPVTQSMILYARYYEKSEPAIINGKEVMAAANDLEDKTINNRYNDKPLVIWTNNGIIVLPAHLKSSVTIPKISNEDNVVTFSNDITRNLDMDTNGHMFGIFLKVSYNRTINDNIVSENRKRNYQEVAGSGFDAEFRQILDNKGNTSHFDYLGTVTLSIDLKAMGISLPEASPAMSRTFYAAHNYAGTSVEYLPLSLSADKGKGTVIVSTLSPFAIVYKDSERTKPSSPSYKLPKTGD